MQNDHPEILVARHSGGMKSMMTYDDVTGFKKEINERPNSFIMFYSARRWEIAESENKINWLPFNREFVYTQAYYVPMWIGKKLSKFLETNKWANKHRWSKGINEYLVQEWIDRYLVQPSLVQHIAKESLNEPEAPFKIIMHQSKTYKYE